MPRPTLILVITTLLAGCRRDVEHITVVAAAPGALECAMRAAEANGYKPAQEPPTAGAPRLARPLFGLQGDPPRAGRDSHITDYLTITSAADSLRIVAVGSTLDGKALAPSPRTLAHVQDIVTQCSEA